MDWKTILERDGPTAWRAAYRLLGNAADADDCLQDAMLTAVQLSRREPIANWRALLTRLTSTRAMDQLRKRYRSRMINSVDDQVPAIADPHDPGDTAQLDELRSQLRIALVHLSQEQATAFCLCALEGWTYTDAGEQLQTPASTIGVLVHRARQQLRDLLQRFDPSHTYQESPMNTNHTPHDPLETAEAALRELPRHIVPSTATLNRIATLVMNAEDHSVSPTTASSAVRGWRKIAALLLTSAALVAVFYSLMHTPQTAFAFEDVVAAVRKASTVSYTTLITPKNGPASQYKNYHKGTLTRMVYPDGSYMVMDMAGQKMLMVQPAMKTATLTHLGGKPEDLPTMGDSIIAWLQTAETTGKAVGEKTIDGVRTLGFEAAFGATTMTLWGDPKTKLPVQIEAMIGPPSEPIQMVMREFVFNAPLEDALFSTTVPAGFEIKETKQPAVDYSALVKLPPEEHVVRILKFYAKLNDGAFPERIDGPELVAKITSSAGKKRIEDPEFMKEFTTLAGSMGATWTFRQSLNKFGYLGTAHLNDADSIVFWYLPKDTEKYRVVFADLTIGDVTEEKLPKVPMK